jgi:serine protease inhibitor
LPSRNALELPKMPTDANLVSSPFSVSTTLAMTWDGARGFANK